LSDRIETLEKQAGAAYTTGLHEGPTIHGVAPEKCALPLSWENSTQATTLAAFFTTFVSTP
jgi:hypothetical protein